MSYVKKLCVYVALHSVTLAVIAQENIPIGTWRTHFSFNQVNNIVEVGEAIYASSKNGLFFFDKQDNSITKLTKLDGLQGGTITALAYDPNTNLILVGYESGNLDLIEGTEISNLNLISTSQVQGSKSINHITTAGGFAYLSTDFGVLKFDLVKREVQETYRELGLNGDGIPEPLEVYMSTIFQDSLFLATEQGVLAANIVANINLLDYQNWRRYDDLDGIPDEPVSIIATKDGFIYSGINNDELYAYENGSWSSAGLFNDVQFNDIYTSTDFLIVADSVAYTVSSDLSVDQIEPFDGMKCLMAIADESGAFWLGSESLGLVSNIVGQYTSYLPSGPSSDHIFRFNYDSEIIYGLSGGFDNSVEPLHRDDGFYQFENGNWKNFSAEGDQIPTFDDIVSSATFNGKKYFSSIGYGLLEIDQNGNQTIYDETNSPLVNISPPGRNTRVPAILSSNDGLWVLNYGVTLIHLIDPQGEWQTFTISSSRAAYATDIIVVGDLLWLIINPSNGGGIVVFDPSTGDTRYLTSSTGSGGLASEDVYTLALDNDGYVWAGTDLGVSVFTNPAFVMSGGVDAVEPIFENRQLLRDEVVTTIKVDGGNRKWMGTENGAWLFDAEADRQIQFFNASNSPLPDNEILDIELHDKTGEVFFATPAGIVSWRSGSTTSENVFGQVEIFPNPVKKDFTGVVGINGLATDADVKITDVSGKLVWKTKANGGTATWNVKDYNGSRADTGIYLVFSASQDGEETFVGKIAVVN